MLKPTRSELISRAREELFNEYVKDRTIKLNQWMIDSDIAWNKDRVKLSYPSFPIYPSEEQILSRVDIIAKQYEEPLVVEPVPEKIEIVEEIEPIEKVVAEPVEEKIEKHHNSPFANIAALLKKRK
jgi:hypothetical protein